MGRHLKSLRETDATAVTELAGGGIHHAALRACTCCHYKLPLSGAPLATTKPAHSRALRAFQRHVAARSESENSAVILHAYAGRCVVQAARASGVVLRARSPGVSGRTWFAATRHTLSGLFLALYLASRSSPSTRAWA